jgi:hypothetical protein
MSLHTLPQSFTLLLWRWCSSSWPQTSQGGPKLTPLQRFAELKHSLRFFGTRQFRLAIAARQSYTPSSFRPALLYAAHKSPRSPLGVEGAIVDIVCSTILTFTHVVRGAVIVS